MEVDLLPEVHPEQSGAFDPMDEALPDSDHALSDTRRGGSLAGRIGQNRVYLLSETTGPRASKVSLPVPL
jgi:hypothetical protein